MKTISPELLEMLENPPRVVLCQMCHGHGKLEGMKCGACGGIGIDRIEKDEKGEAVSSDPSSATALAAPWNRR
jgi:hypothetical protein